MAGPTKFRALETTAPGQLRVFLGGEEQSCHAERGMQKMGVAEEGELAPANKRP